MGDPPRQPNSLPDKAGEKKRQRSMVSDAALKTRERTFMFQLKVGRFS
jgi:hypothetical protein